MTPKSDWLETTDRSIHLKLVKMVKLSVLPSISRQSRILTERLSLLFMERLTPALGKELLALLPSTEEHPELGYFVTRAQAKAEKSIGLPSFIEVTNQVLGSCTELSSESAQDQDSRGREVVEIFLWSLAQGFSDELKSRIRDELPLELRARMDLYSSGSAEAKAA